MSDLIRVTMNVQPSTKSNVEWLVAILGKNASTCIGMAISLYKIIQENKLKGGRLILEDINGNMKEVKL